MRRETTLREALSKSHELHMSTPNPYIAAVCFFLLNELSGMLGPAKDALREVVQLLLQCVYRNAGAAAAALRGNFVDICEVTTHFDRVKALRGESDDLRLMLADWRDKALERDVQQRQRRMGMSFAIRYWKMSYLAQFFWTWRSKLLMRQRLREMVCTRRSHSSPRAPLSHGPRMVLFRRTCA
jgi:hypothetical protein